MHKLQELSLVKITFLTFNVSQLNDANRMKTRKYTSDHHHIDACVFKPLLYQPVGFYTLNAVHLSENHKKLELIEYNADKRSIIFIINNIEQKIDLKMDSSSVSRKLYLSCPHCKSNRQSLYASYNAYACRQCLKLSYESQSKSPETRLLSRIKSLRKKLWGDSWVDVDNIFVSCEKWSKPKHIRWDTFKQKRKYILKLEEKYWPILTHKLNLINEVKCN